jgi:hypothetical protein
MENPVPPSYQNAQPGDIITLGAYPQTAAGSDSTPIQWQVLHHSGAELFVLSRYILDCKQYHAEFIDTTWRDCDLRRWLNETFYPAVFTPAEKLRIQLTICTDNGEGSPDTQDHVFLLSVAEIQAFTDPKDGTSTTIRRRAIGTEYAKIKKPDGCHLYVYDKGVEKDYVVEHGEKLGCSWWWTRSQPQMQDGTFSRAAFIGARSNIKTYGRVDLRYYGVRPALKLRIT